MKEKSRPEVAEKRAHKSLKRQYFLKALPRNAIVRGNDKRYNKSTKIVFGSLHVQCKTFDLCCQVERGHISLVDLVPA